MQNKFIPLKYAPLVFELELAEEAEAVVSPIASTTFDASNTTTKWLLQNCMIKCDTITLDSTLQNQYGENALKDGNRDFHISTSASETQSIATSDVKLLISYRSCCIHSQNHICSI